MEGSNEYQEGWCRSFVGGDYSQDGVIYFYFDGGVFDVLNLDVNQEVGESSFYKYSRSSGEWGGQESIVDLCSRKYSWGD